MMVYILSRRFSSFLVLIYFCVHYIVKFFACIRVLLSLNKLNMYINLSITYENVICMFSLISYYVIHYMTYSVKYQYSLNIFSPNERMMNCSFIDWVCIQVRINVCVCVCVCVYARARVSMWQELCSCVRACVRVRVCLCMCVRTYITNIVPSQGWCWWQIFCCITSLHHRTIISLGLYPGIQFTDNRVRITVSLQCLDQL